MENPGFPPLYGFRRGELSGGNQFRRWNREFPIPDLPISRMGLISHMKSTIAGFPEYEWGALGSIHFLVYTMGRVFKL